MNNIANDNAVLSIMSHSLVALYLVCHDNRVQQTSCKISILWVQFVRSSLATEGPSHAHTKANEN